MGQQQARCGCWVLLLSWTVVEWKQQKSLWSVSVHVGGPKAAQSCGCYPAVGEPWAGRAGGVQRGCLAVLGKTKIQELRQWEQKDRGRKPAFSLKKPFINLCFYDLSPWVNWTLFRNPRIKSILYTAATDSTDCSAIVIELFKKEKRYSWRWCAKEREERGDSYWFVLYAKKLVILGAVVRSRTLSSPCSRGTIKMNYSTSSRASRLWGVAHSSLHFRTSSVKFCRMQRQQRLSVSTTGINRLFCNVIRLSFFT